MHPRESVSSMLPMYVKSKWDIGAIKPPRCPAERGDAPESSAGLTVVTFLSFLYHTHVPRVNQLPHVQAPTTPGANGSPFVYAARDASILDPERVASYLPRAQPKRAARGRRR